MDLGVLSAALSELPGPFVDKEKTKSSEPTVSSLCTFLTKSYSVSESEGIMSDDKASGSGHRGCQSGAEMGQTIE